MSVRRPHRGERVTDPRTMSSPGIRFPPPILWVAGLFAGYAIDRWVHPLPLSWIAPRGAKSIGLVVVAAGFVLMAWGMITFLRARTAIIPHQPASRLVETGPYRFTRNPMYTGMTIAYLGGTMLVDSLWPLLLLPIVFAAVMRLVIGREEAYLSHAFGAAYDEYRGRVGRFF